MLDRPSSPRSEASPPLGHGGQGLRAAVGSAAAERRVARVLDDERSRELPPAAHRRGAAHPRPRPCCGAPARRWRPPDRCPPSSRGLDRPPSGSAPASAPGCRAIVMPLAVARLAAGVRRHRAARRAGPLRLATSAGATSEGIRLNINVLGEADPRRRRGASAASRPIIEQLRRARRRLRLREDLRDLRSPRRARLRPLGRPHRGAPRVRSSPRRPGTTRPSSSTSTWRSTATSHLTDRRVPRPARRARPRARSTPGIVLQAYLPDTGRGARGALLRGPSTGTSAPAAASRSAS